VKDQLWVSTLQPRENILANEVTSPPESIQNQRLFKVRTTLYRFVQDKKYPPRGEKVIGGKKKEAGFAGLPGPRSNHKRFQLGPRRVLPGPRRVLRLSITKGKVLFADQPQIIRKLSAKFAAILRLRPKQKNCVPHNEQLPLILRFQRDPP